MASGRLFGVGFSPPINLGRGGRSPPISYSPFPTHPAVQSSLVVIGDGGKSVICDEDTKFVQNIDDVVHRSDVVYGFAEVKYKQLTPNPPSQPGLGLRQAFGDNQGDVSQDDGLTVEAVVIVAEEALVLYVKGLSLLAKSMDIAARWWAKKKDRGELASASPVVLRMNSTVQWIRGRFNEVLEKAEIVRLKLIESQRRLPEDHPCHPNNLSAATGSSTGMGTSADQVIVSSGITAEKLMYDRALEMSRSAAINELTGEDLPGCDICYVTAIRMLEAVLESDEDTSGRKDSGSSIDNTGADANDDDLPINGLEAETRKTVRTCKWQEYSYRAGIVANDVNSGC
jgi:serine/threonine-protein kinase ULK/ATG1